MLHFSFFPFRSVKSLKWRFFARERGCARKCRGEVPAAKTKNHRTMKKRKTQKTNEKNESCKPTKAVVGTFGFIWQNWLAGRNTNEKMTHIVGMQPANQGDCSKCLWGDIDCASVPWPNRKDMQQPASQIYAPKLWAGPDEPPKPVPQHIGRTLMKNVLPRASQTSNRPHAKLPIQWDFFTYSWQF